MGVQFADTLPCVTECHLILGGMLLVSATSSGPSVLGSQVCDLSRVPRGCLDNSQPPTGTTVDARQLCP